MENPSEPHNSSPEPDELVFLEEVIQDDVIVFVPDDQPASPPFSVLTCWRCEKETPGEKTTCLFCLAPIGNQLEPRLKKGRPIRADHAIIGLFWIYITIMLSSIVVRAYEGLTPREERTLDEEELKGELILMLVVELIDTVIVLGTIAWVRRPPPLGQARPIIRNLTWACTIPFLALLLLMNFTYMRWLKNHLGLPDGQLEIIQSKDLFYWVLLTICIQPAIVEELFFRYLMLGHLRPILGTHGSVLISGFMFGLCHIGNPLGMPLLILLGIGLGYSRVGSRSMVVPMILHGCHNAAVIWSEPWI